MLAFKGLYGLRHFKYLFRYLIVFKKQKKVSYSQEFGIIVQSVSIWLQIQEHMFESS